MVADSRAGAADRDREGIVEILRRAFAEGRLDAAELDERAGAAFQAGTIGGLRRLVADIPRPESDLPRFSWPVAAGRGQGRPRRRAGRSARASLLTLLAALGCILVGAATHNTFVIILALSAGLGAAAVARH